MTSGGVDAVFEAVGIQSTLTSGTQVLKNGGTLIVIALFGKPAELNVFDLVVRE